MSGFSNTNVLLNLASQAVAAEATKQAVSKPFYLSAADSLYFQVDLTTEDNTVAAGITGLLQDSWDGTTWFDKKPVTITGTPGVFTIKLLPEVAGDQQYLPLRPIGRVVVTTGAGDDVTVTAVIRSERR